MTARFESSFSYLAPYIVNHLDQFLDMSSQVIKKQLIFDILRGTDLGISFNKF